MGFGRTLSGELEAIRRGNNIEAIKIVRDYEKTDLLTAKERVDEWAREVE